MSQQKKASKVGRNRTKCERYRARHGRTVGSKRPKKPGSNSPQRTYDRPRVKPELRSLLSDEVSISMALPKGGSRLLSVPRDWVR